jgi:hypothetical protein
MGGTGGASASVTRAVYPGCAGRRSLDEANLAQD